MTSPNSFFRKSSKQVSCKIHDEVAILDLDKAVYFGLQGAAVHIWDVLDSPRSVEDICDSIADTFDISAHDCRPDVVQVLENLQAEGLVEAVN
jgi:hypothetical protein